MKKILLTAVMAILSMAALSAQDLGQATDIYNNGASYLNAGDKAGALTAFEKALEMAYQCEEDEDGQKANLISNIEDVIPSIALSIAKDYIKADDYDNAVKQLEAAVAAAEKYNNPAVAEDAKEMIPQVFMQHAGKLLNSKDYEGAAAAYGKVLEITPDNGMAALRQGMAYGAAGNIEAAENAYAIAIENGQETAAKKQLSNIYVKQAAAFLKEKAYNDALAAAQKSNDNLENATAYKVAGTAASQLKKNEDAVAYLKKYLDLSPNAKDAAQMQYTIAALSQTLGDKATAIEFYNKILTDPKFGETAKQQLGVLNK
ncbi:MAG: tetratricopeptide repeat protein [Bacteroidales bacterium]|nr:tetratricopeptide repeat protein [Bacteroidales bacterium]